MEGMTQKHFQHRVPRESGVAGPRINLTWRWILKHTPRCPAGRLRPPSAIPSGTPAASLDPSKAVGAAIGTALPGEQQAMSATASSGDGAATVVAAKSSERSRVYI